MKRWASGVVLWTMALGCPGTPVPPGDQLMGDYDFRAEPSAGDCPFTEVPDGGFQFQAAFSRFKTQGRYFVTIGGIPHDAMFDGQRITATYGAQRTFSQCNCPKDDAGTRAVVTMTETLVATLVSKSQSDAVGGCVTSPPVDPDAGILKPDSTAEGGFDAVRACGTLSEAISIDTPVVVPTAECLLKCNACSLSYTIAGDRR